MKGVNDDYITLSQIKLALYKELEMEKPQKEIIISLCNQTFTYALIEKFQELKILYMVN